MRALLTGSAILLLAAAAGGDEVMSEESLPRNVYVCHRAAGPIVVDGNLDEAAWQDIPSPVFEDLVTGEPPVYPVTARLLWDDAYLYVGYEVADPNVWAEAGVRDACMFGARNSPFDESFVKVFIDPNGDSEDYIELHGNPLNNQADLLIPRTCSRVVLDKLGLESLGYKAQRARGSIYDWTCAGWKTAVRVHGTLNEPGDVDKGWTVEMAIPFSAIKPFAGKMSCPPNEGDVWRMHLARRYRTARDAETTQYWTWPKTGEVNCHRTDRWGYTVFGGKRGNLARKLERLPKASFRWRALWANAPNTAAEVDDIVRLAHEMHVDALLVQVTRSGGQCWYKSAILKKVPKAKLADPLQAVIDAAGKHGIRVYAWTMNLWVPPKAYFEQHPEQAQTILPEEDRLMHAPRLTPDRHNVHYGQWLCPDHGLVDFEKRILQELARNYAIAGIALDYVGYRNYHACFCEHSNAKRAEFAARLRKREGRLPHSEEMVRAEFSEQSLVDWVAQAREAVLAVKPGLKLACHIYPDFDPNPLYGNRLPVDYCGQTTAWFFKPYWSPEKMYHKARVYRAAQGTYVPNNTHVPFIGIFEKNGLLKSPERLRQEIRIAGSSGSDTIMIAFAATFVGHPDLVRVVSEELDRGGTPPPPPRP
ncbi:MAG: hypothetical protein JXR37_17755 [Kiritimatiellae bacterium]|nr:hypothetical protein [Kiritimatiellia bacterium]